MGIVKHGSGSEGLCRLLTFFISLTFLISSVLGQGRKLSNEDIIKMTKAELPEEVIVKTIQTNENRFDLSPDGLIALKAAKVPDNIIKAMTGNPVRKPSPAQPASPKASNENNPFLTAGNDSSANYGSIVMVDNGKRVELQASRQEMRSSNPMDPRNMFGMKVNTTLPGNHSRIRTTNLTPTFEFSLPTNEKPDDMVVLAKLDVKGDRRELEAARASGLTGVKTGIPAKKLIPVSYEVIGKTKEFGSDVYLYRAKLVMPIVPGEYAWVFGQARLFEIGFDAAR